MNTSAKTTLLSRALALVLLCSLVAPAFSATKRPNIIVILADDLGFSDIDCFGGEINTPNIDALAKDGLRYNQFYNTSRCCPTRASLLTGLYPHEAGVGHMMVDRGFPGYRSDLNKNCVTIAEVLHPAGYRTYAVGKWHVTHFDGPHDNNSNWPLQRGFDKFYGTIKGYGSYYDPSALCRQNTFITPENDAEYHPTQFYYTDAITDNAVKFLREHTQESPDKPFFMYVAYTAAHWPMQALEKDIAKYKGKFDTGYDPVRQERFKRLKEAGLIDPNWQLSPTALDWDKVKRKKWEARCKEVFDAIIDDMDQGIGRIIAQLKDSKQFDNTVILYLHDNGGCAETMGRLKAPSNINAKYKPLGPNDLQPNNKPPMQTRDGRVVRTGPGVMPGPADTFIAYGKGWANVSDTPFREYKHWVHEGGIATPLIVHWPDGISTNRRGAIERQYGHVIDLMPTCVDLSGAQYPKQFAGRDIKPMEGVSLVPSFSGKPLNRKNPLFWEHESNRAIREGKWKLVAKADQPWELYDMETDRTEMHDLAAKYPDKVKAMSAQWDAYASRANVLPLGGWKDKAPKE